MTNRECRNQYPELSYISIPKMRVLYDKLAKHMGDPDPDSDDLLEDVSVFFRFSQECRQHLRLGIKVNLFFFANCCP